MLFLYSWKVYRFVLDGSGSLYISKMTLGVVNCVKVRPVMSSVASASTFTVPALGLLYLRCMGTADIL